MLSVDVFWMGDVAFVSGFSSAGIGCDAVGIITDEVGGVFEVRAIVVDGFDTVVGSGAGSCGTAS